MTISKFDLTGNALWCHAYNTPATVASAVLKRAEGQDITLVSNNGSTGYRAVGWSSAVGTSLTRPFVVDVDNNGYLANDAHRRIFNDVPGFVTYSGGNVAGARPASICRLPSPGGDKFAITGWRDLGSQTDAWLLLMDDALSPGDPLNPPGGFKFLSNTVDHLVMEEFIPFDEGLKNNSSCVEYAANGDIIWPILVEYTPGQGIFDTGANREARALVHRINWSGANPDLLWSTDLKMMRAVNLQLDVAVKTDGDIVLGGTKWQAPFTMANPFNYAWLLANEPSFVQNCLNSPAGLGYDQDPNTPGIQPYDWSIYPYSFWNTNLYSALLRGGTGSLVWHGTYDDVEGAPRECGPNRVKQKECIFSVSATDDGEMIVSGTSSANFDDCYIVKLGTSCDAKADFSYFETNFPLNSNNEHHITSNTNEIWGDQPGELNMKVRGSIIIDAGGSLTITNDAVIQFADSRNMGYTCNIVVMPHIIGGAQGGNLTVTDNAVLTSLAECPGSMWDGVQVLGVSNEALWKNGEFRINDGGSIRNALAAFTNCRVDCLNPTTAPATQPGGVIIANASSFINNRYDVVMRQYNSGINTVQNPDFTNSVFYNNTFATNAPLNYPTLFCETHLYFDRVNRMKVGGNTFAMNSGAIPYAERGTGIYANRTSVQVLPMCSGTLPWDPQCTLANQLASNQFSLLFRGIDATSNNPAKITWVRDAVFVDNAAGIRLNGVTASILRNQISVPDIDLVGTGIDAPYGIGVFECTGFTVENNKVHGNSISQTYTVGAIFSNTNGTTNAANASNRYYNNTFDDLRIGTIIQLDNDGNNPGDGLEIKCNDYGNRLFEGQNTFDIAFTGTNPSVGDRQGAPGLLQTSPAGNTFSTTCGTEGHLFAPIGNVNPFVYWHHIPSSTPKIVLPTCISGTPQLTANFQTDGSPYTSKLDACPGYIEMVGQGEEQRSAMIEAEQEYATLEAVYNNERDGGDTEGLKELVADPASSSSSLRSALMLAAPKVSTEVWEQVFKREQPMSAWHLAQALVANSPLQPEVARMMEESDLTSFYKQLVYGAQGDGINSLTILESEMAHWGHKHTALLNQLAAHALVSENEDLTIADVLAFEAQHPQFGDPIVRIALLMAQGDHAAANDLVQNLRAADPENRGLEVLSLYLEERLVGQGDEAVPTAVVDRLQQIATERDKGHVAAENWLRTLGVGEYPERIILPYEERAMLPPTASTKAEVPAVLTVYPSPAQQKDPVYVVVRLLEGMDHSLVRIVDPAGRLLREERINGQAAIIELDTRDLAAGLFVAGVFVDGLQVGSVKFQITR